MKKNYLKTIVMVLAAVALCLAACALDTDSDFEGTIFGAMGTEETKKIKISGSFLSWDKVTTVKGVSNYTVFHSDSLVLGYVSVGTTSGAATEFNLSAVHPDLRFGYFRVRANFSDSSAGPISSAFVERRH